VVWQLNPQTGQLWPVVSDTEMSEVEVEGAVGGVGDNSLSAARRLIRAEVR